MQIVNEDEIRIKKDQFKIRILRGAVFIHPTDTIYGIGCNAMKMDAVTKVREIKDRVQEKPFSIIAPSKDWIREHCIVDDRTEQWLAKLPGPYTLILRLRDNHPIPSIVNSGKETIGVRMPDHWISEVVRDLNVPIITASANKKGMDYMTSLDDLDLEVKSKMDFIIYEGAKPGKPSTLVNLAGADIKSRKEREIIQ